MLARLCVAAFVVSLGCNAAAPQDSSADDTWDGGQLSSIMLLSHLPDRGHAHVADGSELTFEDNPPASGDHYPDWTRFQLFQQVVPRGYWVHNLEHGGIALLYGPKATDDQRAQLEDLYGRLPEDPECGHSRALLTQDPLMDDALAAVAWRWTLVGAELDEAAVLKFVAEHRAHGLEDVCSHGVYYP